MASGAKIYILKKFVIRFFVFTLSILLTYLLLFSPRIINFYKSKKSLNIFTFPQLIDAEYVAEFEKNTGIKLNISYYENNNELLIKMRKTKGRGYDIVIPSDYTVDILIKEGLLKKIDKSKLTFLNNISEKFLGCYFDKQNQYSVPYLWEVYNIGINKKFAGNHPAGTYNFEPSLKLIFDKNITPGSIIMNNNAREAILLAALYLFGSIDNLDDEKIKQIKDLLLAQKEWVEAYTDLRADYLLLCQDSPIAIGTSGEIWHATRFDEDLDFLVPKEGTFIVIDSIAIPAKSKKDELIYKFLNYLYKPEVVSHHVEKYSLFPTIKDVQMGEYFVTSIEKIWKEAKQIVFFENVLSEKQLNEIWIELKSS
ncbi:PotD/PotF family extracellular solute-binding protein [Candidatus Dependentiae bacterium]